MNKQKGHVDGFIVFVIVLAVFLIVFFAWFIYNSKPAMAEVEGIVSQNGISVARLFNHEGCTMYRFEDAGRYRYYANCQSGHTTVSSEWSESCGKNCVRTIEDGSNTFYSKED